MKKSHLLGNWDRTHWLVTTTSNTWAAFWAENAGNADFHLSRPAWPGSCKEGAGCLGFWAWHFLTQAAREVKYCFNENSFLRKFLLGGNKWQSWGGAKDKCQGTWAWQESPPTCQHWHDHAALPGPIADQSLKPRKRTHRHRKPIYGHQREKGMAKLGVWD